MSEGKDADPPRVTVALLAYNQEAVVGEAVRSLLAQDYTPLEIILSDDGSDDGTFAAIEREAQSYAGPHGVTLNRNAANRGFAEHINQMVDLARCDLLVLAAGDDVSRPERVTKIVHTWEAGGRQAKVVHSAAQRIDAAGARGEILYPPDAMRRRPGAEEILRRDLHVMGATLAFTPDLFARFGPLAAELIAEDRVLPLRAALAGEIAYVPEPLVLYRSGGMSDDDPETWDAHDYLFGKRLMWLRWECDAYRQRYRDLQTWGQVDAELLAFCERAIASREAQLALGQARGMRRIGAAARMLGTAALPLRERLRLTAIYLGSPLYARRYERLRAARER